MQDRHYAQVSPSCPRRAHLAEMASVALYGNDRQFRDPRYRWQQGRTVGYSVRIWLLEDR